MTNRRMFPVVFVESLCEISRNLGHIDKTITAKEKRSIGNMLENAWKVIDAERYPAYNPVADKLEMLASSFEEFCAIQEKRGRKPLRDQYLAKLLDIKPTFFPESYMQLATEVSKFYRQTAQEIRERKITNLPIYVSNVGRIPPRTLIGFIRENYL